MHSHHTATIQHISCIRSLKTCAFYTDHQSFGFSDGSRKCKCTCTQQHLWHMLEVLCQVRRKEQRERERGGELPGPFLVRGACGWLQGVPDSAKAQKFCGREMVRGRCQTLLSGSWIHLEHCISTHGQHCAYESSKCCTTDYCQFM